MANISFTTKWEYVESGGKYYLACYDENNQKHWFECDFGFQDDSPYFRFADTE